MLDSFWKWAVYLLIVATILLTGWKEPLRYRFMSKAEIYALEHPASPPLKTKVVEVEKLVEVASATPTPTPWMWDPNRQNRLERESYNHQYSTRPRSPYRATPYPR